MVKRKIIKQANQAYTLTLPINWVRENNLNKKDSEVEISIQDKSLMVTNIGNVALKKEKFSVEDFDERILFNKINALYARGVDEIEISSSKEISSLLIKCVGQTLGYALVSQSDGKYIIRDIGNGSYSDIDEILKRVFQIVLMFYDSAIEDIFGAEKETLEGIDKRDNEINKFCLYLQRAINKMSCSDPIKGRILFTYSFAVEKIGDEILRLWRTNIENDIEKTKEIRNITNISREGLDLIFDSYYNLDPKANYKLRSLKEKARKSIASMPKVDAPTLRLLHYALLIIEDAADLIHLNLMKNN